MQSSGPGAGLKVPALRVASLVCAIRARVPGVARAEVRCVGAHGGLLVLRAGRALRVGRGGLERVGRARAARGCCVGGHEALEPYLCIQGVLSPRINANFACKINI